MNKIVKASQKDKREPKMFQAHYQTIPDKLDVYLNLGHLKEMEKVVGQKLWINAGGLTARATKRSPVFVWMKHLKYTPDDLGTFFHELCHASVHRCEKFGTISEEFLALSVGELVRAFLPEVEKKFHLRPIKLKV